jgi:outer membrane lipoprotein carrier protein
VQLIERKIRAGRGRAGAAIFAMMLTVASVAVSFGHSGAEVLAREPVASHPAKLKALLARLQRHYEQTKSFRASFKETVARVGAPPQERSGTVYYRKPGRVRFEFGAPQPETIVSDGKLLYDYDPGLNQVMETPLRNAIKTQAIAGFLLGVGNVARDFEASRPAKSANDGLIHLILTPKSGGNALAIGLEPQTLNIERLKLGDALGNVTTISFSGIETNIAIEPSRFEFKTPVGADVVTTSNVH